MVKYLAMTDMQSLFPARVVSKLKSWESSDWEKYNLVKYTKYLTTSGVVDSDCSIFKAVVSRDKASLTAMVTRSRYS